ncbi:MAG TPA: hypothetical protein DCF63_01205 [Planctomycetaceae bacterium]|nr:hypothetical protein [Planctomycetaceae bacterium]
MVEFFGRDFVLWGQVSQLICRLCAVLNPDSLIVDRSYCTESPLLCRSPFALQATGPGLHGDLAE